MKLKCFYNNILHEFLFDFLPEFKHFKFRTTPLQKQILFYKSILDLFEKKVKVVSRIE